MRLRDIELEEMALQIRWKWHLFYAYDSQRPWDFFLCLSFFLSFGLHSVLLHSARLQYILEEACGFVSAVRLHNIWIKSLILHQLHLLHLFIKRF